MRDREGEPEVEGEANGRARGGGERETEGGRELGQRRCLGQKEERWVAGRGGKLGRRGEFNQRPKGREIEVWGGFGVFSFFKTF
jgi:hypothetical protein